MTYSTIEAFLDKNKIIFGDDIFVPKKKTKVLITFIEDDLDKNDDLIELDKKQISKDMIDLQKKVLKKDKSLFTNI